MKIYNSQEILDKLEWCIKNKIPFSHIRFGDGGIKFIHAILNKNYKQLKIILKKEGMPAHKLLEIFELWGYYARHADFIDTPEVYYNDTFWPRVKGAGKAINEKTDQKLRAWKELYECAEIINDNYCNPESNCLMILNIFGRRNIFDLMRNRKVCIICTDHKLKPILGKYDVDIIKIVGQYENQYTNSFKFVVDFIKHRASRYDFWLVAAGELGRIYSGLIKEYGGRTVDLGFVVDYWLRGYLHPRFEEFMVPNPMNRLELCLTELGKKYIDGI